MFLYLIKKIILTFCGKKTNLEIKFLGIKKYLHFFYFQRVLRINSHVPWPVHMSSVVGNPNNIHQKEPLPFVGFHPGTYVNAKNSIYLGKNVRIGPKVNLISANHDLNDYPIHEEASPIKIGDNCWLGAAVTILPGVELGDHVVVASGSVVSKSFGNNMVIGGMPAKKLKDLTDYTGIANWTDYILQTKK